jgi:hypothetical protein
MRRTLLILISFLTAHCTAAQTYSYCETKLHAADPTERSGFGDALVIDGSTIVVGAPFQDGVESDEGAAYVFEFGNGAWTQTAKLSASNPKQDDRFGASLALKGDLLVIGAPFADRGLLRDSGAVYVFRRVNGTWRESAILTSAFSTPLALFGFSVDTDGSLIVVGAPGAAGVGTAYVFADTGDAWTQTALLTANEPAPAAFFGDAVRLSENTIVIGAPGFPNSGLNGAAYIFQKPEGGWSNATETAKLTANDSAREDFFGDAVAISGDTIIVGAEGHDAGADHTGAAYVYHKPADGWVTTSAFDAKLLPDDRAQEGEFGDSIGVEGDRWMFSAEGDDANGEDSGAAYLFEAAQQTGKIIPSDIAPFDHFGQVVAIHNGLIVIGAPDDDDGVNRAGSVYVFTPCD